MKTLRNEKDILLALELHQLNERSKADTKRMNEIKEHFKGKIDDAAKIGDLLITVSNQSRESVDKKLLISELGDKCKKFLKITEFKTLKITKLAA